MKTRAVTAISAGILFFSLMAYGPKTYAEVRVNIGIGVPAPQVVIHPPPPVVIHEPPAVVVIPGTYVYFAPDVGMDIFFYHGYWYRPQRGHWYRAGGYDGPWDSIEGRRVPHAVRALPPDFRHTVRHHERIRHVDLQRNWREWEHKKHWDRPDYRREVRDGHDGGRWKDYHGTPDRRHEVRDAGYDTRWETNRGRPEREIRPEQVRQVGNTRDDDRWGNDKKPSDSRGKHHR